jgi:hypothetical protein
VIRMQATADGQTTVAQRTIHLDTQAPSGTLVFPAPLTVLNAGAGYVEIQWSDAGAAGLDGSTFDADDVTITGVTVDGFEDLGGGLVRYTYSGGDSLPEGTIQVQLIAGAAADLAGNINAAATFSFVIDRLGPVGMLNDPAAGSTISDDPGYVEIQWLDIGLAGLDTTSFDTDDVTVTGVNITRVEDRDNGLVRYWYDGQSLPAGAIVMTLPAGVVSDLAGNPSESATASYTMATADDPVDVTALVTVQYFGVQYNRRTGVWAFYGQVTNDSDAPLSAPIRVLWTDLEPEGSVVINADGTLADGTPYFEIDVENGVLEPGETSTARTFALQTPSRTQYSFTTIVTAMLPPGSDALQDGTSDEGGSLITAPIVYPLHNYENPHDVDDNGTVEPLDVLIVVNYVNTYGPGPLPEPTEPPQFFPDVHADGAVTALDALILVNALNAAMLPGEGEAASTAVATLAALPAWSAAPTVPGPVAGPLLPPDAPDAGVDLLAGNIPANGSMLLDDFAVRPDRESSLPADDSFEDLLAEKFDLELGLNIEDLLDDLAENLAHTAMK